MRAPRILWLLPLACSSEPQPVPFTPKATIPAVGADPLGAESCPVYQDERCVGGKRQRCEIVEVASRAKVEAPDELLRRVYLYDRWYDRHMSPLGLTMERSFTGTTAPDAPEAEWSAPERFREWSGRGDSAIWTGAALNADIFRYAVTKTEADYRRMEDRVRALVRDFEVTGTPGYLARYHFLKIPDEVPNTPELILKKGALGEVDIELPSLDVEGLPQEYRAGVPDGQGGVVQAQAYWNGDTSIDQYTGPMTTFPIAWSLLRDEALKARMVHHLTCYLKRLQRIEIINLARRPDLVQEVLSAFGGSRIKLDPGDPDIRELDRLVWYVHPGVNRTNKDQFEGSTCPEQVQLEPARVIDALGEHFELDLLQLNLDINRDARNQPVQYDHFYIVNLRGGDASHLMHLAAMAYYFTGDPQYERFLFDELIGKLRVDEVALTMMAFRLPDWCFRFYGDHITYGTHWQLVTMLPDGALKDRMIQVMQEEAWEKAKYNQKDAKFDVMYASIVPSADPRAKAEAVSQLRDFGGNGGTKDAPRRHYSHSRQSIIDRLPAGTTVRCPTPDERLACEQGGTLLGFPLEGESISYACDGRPGECRMDDGKCVEGLASEGLPPSLRNYADFMWQRSPFDIGESYRVQGVEQSPGRDLSEPYWMARYYGYLPEGEGQALAWTDAGACAD